MKKLSLVLVAILFAITGILAQTPNEFKYQAVLRDASGAIMADQAVTVDISILQGSASGTSVFNETHNVTTTEQGLINLNIGSVDDMSSINWSTATYFIEISVNSTVMGTSQLLSVPYALQAKTAESIDYSNVANAPSLFSGDYNDLSNQPTLFDGAYANLTGTPTLFDGAYVNLTGTPTLFDGNWSSITGTTPDVSTFTNDANYLTSFTELDPAVSSNFDFTETSNGDLLKFNGTKFVKFTPNYLTSFTELDGSVTNEIQTLSQVIAQNSSAGNANITGLANPVNAQDAATKAYVDLLEARIAALENPSITVTDIDGNTYNGVKVGTQIWMSDNLKVTHYADGSEIDPAKPAPAIYTDTEWAALDNNETDKAYCFYNDDINSRYGALYTYAAASNGDNSGAGVQGICPDGWHLPTDAEWTTLKDELGGESIAGGKLKEAGSEHWISNTGATNESSFTALPGGSRNRFGTFGSDTSAGNWWSATQSNAAVVFYLNLSYSSAEAFHYSSYKSNGFSVRCIRN